MYMYIYIALCIYILRFLKLEDPHVTLNSVYINGLRV